MSEDGTLLEYEDDMGQLWKAKICNESVRISFHDGIEWNTIHIDRTFFEKLMEKYPGKMDYLLEEEAE